jgi:hypothetical protein
MAVSAALVARAPKNPEALSHPLAKHALKEFGQYLTSQGKEMFKADIAQALEAEGDSWTAVMRVLDDWYVTFTVVRSKGFPAEGLDLSRIRKVEGETPAQIFRRLGI